MNSYQLESNEKILAESKRLTDWGTAMLFLFSALILILVGAYASAAWVRWGGIALGALLLLYGVWEVAVSFRESAAVTDQRVIYCCVTPFGLRQRTMAVGNIRRYRVFTSAKAAKSGSVKGDITLYPFRGGKLTIPVLEQPAEFVEALKTVIANAQDMPKEGEANGADQAETQEQ